MDLLERLSNKFLVGDGCWTWIASRTWKGYGKIHLEQPRRTAQAHRVVYELMVGPIPDGLELDHLCRNRACVRPSHLEPVTHVENVRRGEGGRYRGVTHCLRGHPFEGDNLYVKPSGRRVCVACKRDRAAEYRRRKRLARLSA